MGFRARLGMVVRRAIVILAALIFVAVGAILYLRVRGGAERRSASLFDDASPIEGAFRRALGPEPPVVELSVEPGQATARVVVGPQATQRFTLSRDTGYVQAGSLEGLPSGRDVTFSLTTVAFAELPEMIAAGRVELAGEPSMLVVERPPGAPGLRYRLYGMDGTRFVEIAPDGRYNPRPLAR